MLDKAFQVFTEKFPPKQNLETSDLQLTTGELMRSFDEFGVVVEEDNFLKRLYDAGYRFLPMDDDGHMVFKWLL